MFQLRNLMLILLFSLLFTLTRLSYAAMAGDNAGFKISVYGGTSLTSVNATNLVGFAETDSLNPRSHKQYDPTWGLGAAYSFLLADNTKQILHDASVGLDLLYFKDTQNGYVWLYQQPAYNNYYYHLPITSVRLMADGELTFHSIGQYFFPFITAGVGLAHHTVRYYDDPLLPGTIGLSINSHSQNQLAYTAGAGIKIILPFHSELSLRYLYVDMGTVETSSAASMPLVTSVKAKLTSQIGLIGLTHFFN